MIRKLISIWLKKIACENLLLFGTGPLNCARLGEINKKSKYLK